jgi:hypothetical protein
MKNLFKILFLLVAITTTAQQEVNTTFASQMAILFRPLDKTKVTNGILLFFNTEKHNTSDKDHFIQAISELHRASNKSKFIDTS